MGRGTLASPPPPLGGQEVLLHPSRRSGLDSLRRGSHGSYACGARPHPRPLALIACPPPRLTAMYYGGVSRADV